MKNYYGVKFLESIKYKNLLIALISFMYIACASAQNRYLKACGNDEYPPWNWMQDGKIVGVCTDLAQKAFASKGYSLDVSYVGPWARCQQLLNAGVVDVSLCAVPTSERSNYLHIIEQSIAYNEVAAFVLDRNKDLYTNHDDLINRRIGMIRGVRLGEPMDSLIEKSGQVYYSSRLENLWSLLLLGRIDVVLFGREAGNIQIKQLKLNDRIIAASTSISKVPLNIMISKRSSHFESVLGDIYDIGQFFLSRDLPRIQMDAIRENSEKYLAESKKTVVVNVKN